VFLAWPTFVESQLGLAVPAAKGASGASTCYTLIPHMMMSISGGGAKLTEFVRSARAFQKTNKPVL
jgi:hypothetical protein